jgi:hypothetical protein
MKAEHAKMFPDYSYQPRKTSDKKRRMTPRKAAKLNALAQTLVRKETGNQELQNVAYPLPLFPQASYCDHGVMLGFNMGNPSITPETFSTMAEAINSNNINNSYVTSLTNSPGDDGNTLAGRGLTSPTNLPHPPEAIITASPHEYLNGDLSLQENMPQWTRFNSAHRLDNGNMDAEYSDYFGSRSEANNGVRYIGSRPYCNLELERQAELVRAFEEELSNL